MELQELANKLRRSEVFSGKRSIDFVRSAFGDAFASSGIANGDDTAAGRQRGISPARRRGNTSRSVR